MKRQLFKTITILFFGSILCLLGCKEKQSENIAENIEEEFGLKALIIDGQNNHGVWPKTTMMMKDYLEETGLFKVDVYRSKFTYQGPHHGVVDGYGKDSIMQLATKYALDDRKMYMAKDSIIPDIHFSPRFEEYDVVVSNFGWQSSNWQPQVKRAFENYIENGGGLVVVHAANNAWGDWEEFNKMIGVGGWGDRSLDSGFHIYYDEGGNEQRTAANGMESSHGPEVEFKITTRAPEHPIMRGLPEEWMHTKDELYDRLRGPAENVTILATAYSDVEENAQPWALENKGSGRHEPMLMTINYGEGRIFHTTLGHMDFSMESVGFITTLQRGAEWAAIGNVTIGVPNDFPTKKESSSRNWDYKK
ncbi:ThuA domain-containing protein [Dokdonia sinensis]|uniref:ThuA domain-containing protein n=1 Tax=Dokdonia sinensis TaxID=2479847 RepID=A0A3M0G205_9FLAO|nr:ThuA domain-containing protein [Dokdonia sinensis]RMB58608.1 ThuA domain-containing protein [Dokdonia sinensis]